jgi:hypothetical protein
MIIGVMMMMIIGTMIELKMKNTTNERTTWLTQDTPPNEMKNETNE